MCACGQELEPVGGLPCGSGCQRTLACWLRLISPAGCCLCHSVLLREAAAPGVSFAEPASKKWSRFITKCSGVKLERCLSCDTVPLRGLCDSRKGKRRQLLLLGSLRAAAQELSHAFVGPSAGCFAECDWGRVQSRGDGPSGQAPRQSCSPEVSSF